MSGTRFRVGRGIVGAAELGAPGGQELCPGLMSWGIVFVKTGPLMTLSQPLPAYLNPNSTSQSGNHLLGFHGERFRLDHLQHLLSVYLPTTLNPLDKL